MKTASKKLSNSLLARFAKCIHDGPEEEALRLAKQTPSLLHGECFAAATFFHDAAGNGRTALCQMFLHNGFDANASDLEGKPSGPLSDAAWGGQVDTMKLLLKNGAYVDGTDLTPVTPLMCAAIEGQVGAARLLLEQGAEINRESLRSPFTATAFAEFYRVKQGEQQAVATFLREHGGINPFNEGLRPWLPDTPGLPTIELIERTLGVVHPHAMFGKMAHGDTVTIRRTRFAPKAPQYRFFHLLFTTDLASRAGCELAVCVQREWPLHERALQKGIYRLPIDLLCRLGEAALAGRKLAHGTLIEREDAALAGLVMDARIRQWLCVEHQSLRVGRGRRARSVRTLLLVPNIAKGLLRAGSVAREKADAKAVTPWSTSAAKEGRNSLVVPLCYDAPWLHSMRWTS